MKAFLTGSQVYGTPRPDSDIDLAVLMTSEDATRLCELAGKDAMCAYRIEQGASIKFGNLNVLVFVDENQFRAWKEGTEELIARKPVTRDEAIKALDAKEQEAFAFDSEPSMDAELCIAELPAYEV